MLVNKKIISKIWKNQKVIQVIFEQIKIVQKINPKIKTKNNMFLMLIEKKCFCIVKSMKWKIFRLKIFIGKKNCSKRVLINRLKMPKKISKKLLIWK